ncbi:spermidine/putrescine ABC transporter substrate-binding protein [Ventosimonas gracilis]|uniref:Spermidine/putrescine ABC transporter substrate-binding protein n=1 Tax=Ventosimonas gracilis TaxID=1680762 RepID=A0A139SWY4_9GAMM|nr:ABC transporter substrate-binding protein [Ventosimonas gracilis]KXU39135.1 spermidine/putrescine ABC transporter substrate-binding protein [Ventosimonas gracilis]
MSPHNLTPLLLACLITAAVQAAEPIKSLGKSEGQLNIVAWPGFIERGETDPDYDWVTPFEQETGCKVNVKIAGTSDEMVSLMARGGYDLVTASGDASLRLVAGGHVAPINIDLIANWKTLDARLQNAPWHTVDGKHYGVSYTWGPNVLMYNTDVFKTTPTTWRWIFEEQTLPDGKSNKGRVQAYDGPIYIADAALYLKTHKPELGINDPYQLTEAQYAAALALLREQHKLVHRYWHDTTVQMNDLRNEGVVISSGWPFTVNSMQRAGEPLASTVPVEGATGWADTTMMHASAKNPNCAYQWLNWSLNPKVQGDVAAWFGSVPAVPAACSGNALLGEDGCTLNGFDTFDQISFWKTPQSEGGQFVPYSRWVQDYIAIMGGR